MHFKVGPERTPSRSSTAHAASRLQQGLSGACDTSDLRGRADLGAGELFEEVIRCDSTFGELLREIKVVYETFLSEHGAAVPADPIRIMEAASGIADGAASAAARPARHDQSGHDGSHAELAVDAARRKWMVDEEDVAPDSDDAKILELERENMALRTLVRRLVADVEGEKGVPDDEALPRVGSKGAARSPIIPALDFSRLMQLDSETVDEPTVLLEEFDMAACQG